MVFVTDLSFSLEQLTKLSHVADKYSDIQFYFIDHHPFEGDYSHLKSENFHIVISDKASATKLTNLYIKKNWDTPELPELDQFVDYVNAYDIWLDDTPEFKVGFVYNELFWLYGFQHFWGRFNGDYKLRNSDKEKYKEVIQKKNKLLDKLWKSGRVLDIGNKDLFMIFIDEYHSHITLDYTGYKVYVIISSNGKCSVRLKNVKDKEQIQGLMFNEIEKLPNINNFGGHHGAFGIGLQDNDPHKMIEFAKSMMHVVDSALTNAGEI
jgi:oligoribonuclease NrnB/cAMP/cGMP phosphodiesterase (DHH superfamily)